MKSPLSSCAAKKIVTLIIACSTLLALSLAVPAQDAAALKNAAAIQQKTVGPADAAKTLESPVPPAAAKPAEDAEAKKKSDEEAKKKADETKKKTEHLQKIQQLQFDRRPSAVFRAWSTPLETEEQKKEEAKKSETPVTPADPTKPATPSVPKDPFDAELKVFQRNVTLSDWPEVKGYLAQMPEEEGKALYRRMLQAFQGAPVQVPPGTSPEIAAQIAQRAAQQGGQNAPWLEKNSFSFDDLLALANAAPRGLEKEHLPSLGMILRAAIDAGNLTESFLGRLREELKKPEAEAAIKPRDAAKLLIASDRAVEAGEFLPPLDKAKDDNDHEALNLLSRHFLALHTKEKKTAHLEQAWHVTQAVLAAAEIKKEEKEEALKRAVELAPKIREELGQSWLEESFTSRPERGMEIIAAIGTGASVNLQQQPANPDFRLKGLQLQNTAVEALLKAAPDKADSWRNIVNLLAVNWLREAGFAYQFDRTMSFGPQLRRDPYGNYFYMNDDGEMMQQFPQQPNQVRGIKTTDILEIKPSDRWLTFVKDSLRPKFDMVFAQLYLKVNEENRAFPYIEGLTKSHPDRAKELVEEFLRVWTRNHDPNASRNRTNSYMYMYGFERRAEGIPLTRSKQERNLTELAELVTRLKGLDIGDLNEELLARAFTTCHSSAEVYQLDSIEKVFGKVEALKPKTLAELAQQMRANLVGVWRQPAVQKDKKTNRKQKDIQAEVLRGYNVARAMVAGALEKHSGEWTLQLAKAAIDFDELTYRKELAADSTFSEKREQAYADFQRAVEMYANAAKDLPQEEETTRVFELWFYAGLGACDLGAVTEDKLPDLRQPSRIREAILALPGESADRHMKLFANTLFTRMSSVSPAVKFRYVRTGLDIVGDHKQAAEAHKVFDYYKDLVSEIKLETVIDGSDSVGQQPFGVFVNLRHTREIERESGGFGRYLQNQNANQYFSYNYGRPTENYRDKFQDVVKQSLGEHFDILSVTFQDDKVNSRAIPGEYGWRYTPYAYLLLKARGPEVDKLAPLRLDLDFLDTSGYAILPIESPAVPVDASADSGQTRPVQKLELTQTLDERRADEGKLVLEVKATAQGLVPDLDDLLQFKPQEFDITDVEDQGVSVSKFDPDSEQNLIVSERTWLVSMQAKPDLPERPKAFRFGTAMIDGTEVVYQRYEDADLAKVESEISLEEQYGKPKRSNWWLIAAMLAVLGAVAIAVILWPRKVTETAEARFHMPDKVTPFTVLGLLRQIESNNGFDDASKRELVASIHQIESHYFEGDGNGDAEPNIHAIAESWLVRVN